MSNNVQQGYNRWANSYDAVENKTRDMDKMATQTVLKDILFSDVLELGCGTGKNTIWLAEKAKQLMAVDFAAEMIAKAKVKVASENVQFMQTDITQPWPLDNNSFDLITCNLILEHIVHLEPVFTEARRVLKPDGKFYISELHPFKEYTGSKARFEQNNEQIILDCYTHHISDFFNSAVANGFCCIQLNEWFDEEEKALPRLITFLFKKKK